MGQQQQQQQWHDEVLVVAQLRLEPAPTPAAAPSSCRMGSAKQQQGQDAEGGAAADEGLHPTTLASPFPATHAGSDGAVLASENKYWQLLGRREQQHWRLPPATPAFSSWLLRAQPLPQLASTVLAAWTNSSSGACDTVFFRGSCAVFVTLMDSSHVLRSVAHNAPPLDEWGMRTRLAYSSTASGAGPPLSWTELLTRAVRAPVSAWLQAPASLVSAAAGWHVTRRAAAAGQFRACKSLCVCVLIDLQPPQSLGLPAYPPTTTPSSAGD